MKKLLFIIPVLFLTACEETLSPLPPECWNESTQALVVNIIKDLDSTNENVSLSAVAEIRADKANKIRYCDADVEKAFIGSVKLKNVGYTVRLIRMEGGWGQQVQIISYNNIDVK